MSSSKASFSSSILLLLLALCIFAFPLPSAHGAPSLTSSPATAPTGSVGGPGQTQPPPTAGLTVATVCASSDGGSWIVGLNGKAVTLVKVLQGSTTPPQTFTPTPTQQTDGYFKTGKCFEGNATAVYYISDSLTGYYLINGATASWKYLNPQPKSSFPVENLNASTSTVGLGKTGSTDSMAVSVFNGEINRWDLLNNAASTVGNLTGYVAKRKKAARSGL